MSVFAGLGAVAGRMFMAGMANSSRVHYITCARNEKGDVRAMYVRFAREANHRMLAEVRAARELKS